MKNSPLSITHSTLLKNWRFRKKSTNDADHNLVAATCCYITCDCDTPAPALSDICNRDRDNLIHRSVQHRKQVFDSRVVFGNDVKANAELFIQTTGSSQAIMEEYHRETRNEMLRMKQKKIFKLDFNLFSISTRRRNIFDSTSFCIFSSLLLLNLMLLCVPTSSRFYMVNSSESPNRECCDSQRPSNVNYNNFFQQNKLSEITTTQQSATSLPPSSTEMKETNLPFFIDFGRANLYSIGCGDAIQECKTQSSVCSQLLQLLPVVCGIKERSIISTNEQPGEEDCKKGGGKESSVGTATIDVMKCRQVVSVLNKFSIFTPSCHCLAAGSTNNSYHQQQQRRMRERRQMKRPFAIEQHTLVRREVKRPFANKPHKLVTSPFQRSLHHSSSQDDVGDRGRVWRKRNEQRRNRVATVKRVSDAPTSGTSQKRFCKRFQTLLNEVRLWSVSSTYYPPSSCPTNDDSTGGGDQKEQKGQMMSCSNALKLCQMDTSCFQIYTKFVKTCSFVETEISTTSVDDTSYIRLDVGKQKKQKPPPQCNMNDRDECKNAYIEMRRKTILFACICPRSSLPSSSGSTECSSIFETINLNPCVDLGFFNLVHPEDDQNGLNSQKSDILDYVNLSYWVNWMKLPTTTQLFLFSQKSKEKKKKEEQMSQLNQNTIFDAKDDTVSLSSTCDLSLNACYRQPACSNSLGRVSSSCVGDVRNGRVVSAGCMDVLACKRSIRDLYASIPKDLAIDIAFCLCRTKPDRDEICLKAQALLHPTCAQQPSLSSSSASFSLQQSNALSITLQQCDEVARSCSTNLQCSIPMKHYESACSPTTINSIAQSQSIRRRRIVPTADQQTCSQPPSECREATLRIVTTDLRTSCSCDGSSADFRKLYDCYKWHKLIWLNPCVVEAQKDYHNNVRPISGIDEKLFTPMNVAPPSTQVKPIPTPSVIKTKTKKTSKTLEKSGTVDWKPEESQPPPPPPRIHNSNVPFDPGIIPVYPDYDFDFGGFSNPTDTSENYNEVKILFEPPPKENPSLNTDFDYPPSSTPPWPSLNQNSNRKMGRSRKKIFTSTAIATTPESTTLPPKFCSLERPGEPSVYIREGHRKRLYKSNDPECSELCECTSSESLTCKTLNCVPKEACNTGMAFYSHASPFYVAFRGQCLCYSGTFICAKPPLEYELYLERGVYLYLGYSMIDEQILGMASSTSSKQNQPREAIHNSAVEAIQALVSYHNINMNKSDCNVGLARLIEDNLILVATLEESEMARQNNIVTDHHLYNEKIECYEAFEVISNKINTNDMDMRTHEVLSTIKVATVEAIDIPDLTAAEVRGHASQAITIRRISSGVLFSTFYFIFLNLYL